MSTEMNEWKKCSTCKTTIPLGGKYYVCSVSTCNSERTGYQFCSVNCFDQHVPGARHKNAGAIDKTAPLKINTKTGANQGRRIIAKSTSANPSNLQKSRGGEPLIIASRLKEFIDQQSEYNMSAAVIDVLSDHVRHVAMQAIDNARANGRKTVMDQDLKFLSRLNLNI